VVKLLKDDRNELKHYSQRFDKHKSHPYTKREERYGGRVQQSERAERMQRSQPVERYQEPTPKPIGTYCNPACPLFRCAKKALIIKLVNGRPVAWCTWVNDVCIVHKCQYASCAARYLLPDGRCLAVLKSSDKGEDEFMKELEEVKTKENLKNLLSRRGLRKDLGIEEL
jgi:hypothetical protein